MTTASTNTPPVPSPSGGSDTLAFSSVLADLRHDLRNPIGNIIGYGEMMIDDATETGHVELVPDLEKICIAGKTLLTLVEERLSDAAMAEFVPSSYPGDFVAAPPPTVTPPTAPPPSAPALRRTEAAVDTDDGSPAGFLLVVDDVEENRDVLARRLERQGHGVVSAASGEDALALLAGQGFDLVLLDIMMPGMDGYEVLRRIQADPALRHTPVIVVSALDQMDSVVRCIEMGAKDYLPKPFDPTLLKARVGACLRDKRAHDREAHLFSELQRSYGRLQELEKMRDALTGMIVHDLRTPLTTLLTGMQSVTLMGDLNPDQAEVVGMAIDGGRTLLGMINDLLDISKMEDGSLSLEIAELRTPELIDSAVKQVALLAREKGLTMNLDVDPDHSLFRGDEDKLRRTLVNLIGNAIKFTPEGGAITLTSGPEPDTDALLFAVHDTGEGIPKESFGRIFEKFGQVEGRKAGRKMSTGLGLTFCKMAVEAHKGRIWVESEPGNGSTFFFTIPRNVPGA